MIVLVGCKEWRLLSRTAKEGERYEGGGGALYMILNEFTADLYRETSNMALAN